MNRLRSAALATVALATVWGLAPLAASAQSAALLGAQPAPGPDVSPYVLDAAADPALSNDEMAALVRAKIKYVFVIFNENESFDHEYGALPGVNGLYSDGQGPRSGDKTPGFTQTYTDIHGATVAVQPFRIGPNENATFMDSVDHSHKGLAAKLDVVDGQPRMDGFAADEYARYAGTKMAPKSPEGEKEGTQFARLVMSHIDCDTIPFFWRYASRFTIFDNIFATEDTPSTPNAVAMLAGQAGETQWVEHGSSGATAPISGAINGTSFSGTATTQGPPLVNDPQPWWGSQFDATAANREPTSPSENWGKTNIASNLTFASVPLTLAGDKVAATTAQDANPAFDLPDVQQDIRFIQSRGGKAHGWRWYQNGYDAEPNDSAHANYVSHHNGAQYFGYLADNPVEQTNLRGENDFFNDLAADKLPPEGGVIYIRGGFVNLKNQTPPIQNPAYPNPAGLPAAELATINQTKSGDDDHPGYSDRQLSEAMNARVVNAIAGNPALWSQSAIIITYDESDGFYDHVPPRILSYGPDKLPLSRGVRVPLLLISPFARAHAVSHAEGDHNAVIETLNAIFDLPPLSTLPDEAKALAAGNSPAFNQFGPPGFEQKYLGPRDANSPITDSLLSGFSTMRLQGKAAPLPADYAAIPSDVVESLPHYGGKGCAAIGVTPTDHDAPTPPPAGFNTLPSTLPRYN